MRLRSLGLTERLLAILLVVAAIDFAANTFLFDSATTSALRKDDAARISEHVVVAARMVVRERPERRADLARLLSTPRFAINWSPPGSSSARSAVEEVTQPSIRELMIMASPDLAQGGLRLAAGQGEKPGEIVGTLQLADGGQLGFRTYAGEAQMKLASWQILPMLLPTLLLGGLAWMMFRATIRSLQTLVQALRHIEASNPRSLPERGPDEVRQLIRAYNQMQSRIQRSQAERTQSMLAIGHDLRTPLSRLQLRLDNAPLEDEARADLEHDIAEMLHLLESLQAFVDAGGTQIPPQRIDIAIMAATLIDSAADQGAAASYIGPESLEVMARAVSIRRALANLIENALHYAGKVSVHIEDRGDVVEIRVEDNGPGIPEDRMEDVFQPFFRLDVSRARDTPGMGLGLAIVREAVRFEGGTLVLRNLTEGGLAAIVTLPRTAVWATC
jgi:signal transduction histidine kinase